MRDLAVACAAVLVLGSGAGAETYLVHPVPTMGDFPNIQAAVDSVVTGDVIELADGVFRGRGNRDIDYLGKNVTIRSRSGDPLRCIIDCQGSEMRPHRGFNFRSREEGTAILEGVTITNGHSLTYMDWDGGGAIHIDGFSWPTIRNCIFRQNVAESGSGGAIFSNLAGPLFADCVFLENSAEHGGAMWWGDPSGTMSRCSFIGNRSARDGGALWIDEYEVAIEDCVFSFNHSDGWGGAVYCPASLPNFDRCTFWGNSADDRGGAFFLHATRGGPTLTNCTLVENSAGEGGGMFLYDRATPILENTIIAFSLEGGGVACSGMYGGYYWGWPQLSCCDIFGNVGGNWISCIRDFYGEDGNISADPLFCDVANADFSLHADSPCAPFSPQNPECDLVGAWPVGCAPSSLPEAQSGISESGLELLSPNPFVERTWIRFTVPVGADAQPVSLSIHDCSGRLVRSLAGGAPSFGGHVTSWDGVDGAGHRVPGGIYFCRLVVGEQEFSRRVLKVR